MRNRDIITKKIHFRNNVRMIIVLFQKYYKSMRNNGHLDMTENIGNI